MVQADSSCEGRARLGDNPVALSATSGGQLANCTSRMNGTQGTRPLAAHDGRFRMGRAGRFGPGLLLAILGRMKKIEAIIKPHRLDEVKERLGEIGVSGMTISDVKGVGRTGGQREVYRGAAYVVEFVAKIRIEILVSDSMLHDVVSVIVQAARTGTIGDGKIFVSTVEDAIRIRTDEHGELAI